MAGVDLLVMHQGGGHVPTAKWPKACGASLKADKSAVEEKCQGLQLWGS